MIYCDIGAHICVEQFVEVLPPFFMRKRHVNFTNLDVKPNFVRLMTRSTREFDLMRI
ncbi:hypothetical protein M408DRAFT_193938 [Serendipita vermifera MAFF 305830]|uniref:Uncharacterized protein n=1 Tax=Serendipita vermifera MAFF 305830 TaxID=933852 RepID=A0A0C3AHX6_SERVB|nr:hypothetical protein M408DRAFT_193938 [Serendipita vermifera MAFF 305830]